MSEDRAPRSPGALDFTALVLSAILWSLEYLAFAITFAPMLVRRRVDGRPAELSEEAARVRGGGGDGRSFKARRNARE